MGEQLCASLTKGWRDVVEGQVSVLHGFESTSVNSAPVASSLACCRWASTCALGNIAAARCQPSGLPTLAFGNCLQPCKQCNEHMASPMLQDLEEGDVVLLRFMSLRACAPKALHNKTKAKQDALFSQLQVHMHILRARIFEHGKEPLKAAVQQAHELAYDSSDHYTIHGAAIMHQDVPPPPTHAKAAPQSTKSAPTQQAAAQPPMPAVQPKPPLLGVPSGGFAMHGGAVGAQQRMPLSPLGNVLNGTPQHTGDGLAVALDKRHASTHWGHVGSSVG